MNPSSNAIRILTGYYGLYQAVHIIVNTRGTWLLTSGAELDFPAPPPSGGWPLEVVHLMVIIGILDLLNAIASLFFVRAYFKQEPTTFWLGNLTLTVSVYAFGLYVYWTYASGAWSGVGLWAYVFVAVTFLPILVLWCFFCYWGSRNELEFAKPPNE